MENNAPIILIADIDDINRICLSVFLAKEGYRIETANLSSEVIKKVQNMYIDLVIIDVKLLRMKGYEIITILKKINPGLIIIAISSSNSLELAKKVRQKEVFFYAIKPLDHNEIKLVVRDAFKIINR